MQPTRRKPWEQSENLNKAPKGRQKRTPEAQPPLPVFATDSVPLPRALSREFARYTLPPNQICKLPLAFFPVHLL